VNIPSVPDVIAAFVTAAEQGPEPGLDYYGPCDRVAEPEPEASL